MEGLDGFAGWVPVPLGTYGVFRGGRGCAKGVGSCWSSLRRARARPPRPRITDLGVSLLNIMVRTIMTDNTTSGQSVWLGHPAEQTALRLSPSLIHMSRMRSQAQWPSEARQKQLSLAQHERPAHGEPTRMKHQSRHAARRIGQHVLDLLLLGCKCRRSVECRSAA